MSISRLFLPESDTVYNSVYLSSSPGYPYFRRNHISQDLKEFKKLGIDTIFYFTALEDEFYYYGEEFLEKTYDKLKIEAYNFPIEDHSVPDSKREVYSFCNSLEETLKEGKKVLLHCAAGLGRTGLMAAAYLIIKHKYPANRAIRTVRLARPGAIESFEQEEYLRNLTK